MSIAKPMMQTKKTMDGVAYREKRKITGIVARILYGITNIIKGGGVMERLTYKGKEKIKAYCDYETRDIINKLAEYEDLEEQGLLLRLPCKVGDMLYYPEKEFNIVIPVRLNEIIIYFFRS